MSGFTVSFFTVIALLPRPDGRIEHSHQLVPSGMQVNRILEAAKSSGADPTSYHGQLNAYVIEGEDESLTAYELIIDKKIQRLVLNEAGSFVSGSTLDVSGYAVGDLVIADISDVAVVALPIVTAVTGERRIAIVLVDFNDSPPRPFTPEIIEAIAFVGHPQTYYQNQSYGKVSLTGDVYDWFRLNRNGPAGAACPSIPDFSASDTEQIVLGSGIDLSRYDHLMIFASHPCLERGVSSVGAIGIVVAGQIYNVSKGAIGEAWQYDQPSARGEQPFLWTNFDHLFSHELGHGLGLQHAKGLDCDQKSFYQSHPNECTIIEYGNHFDLMARARFTLGLNAFHRERLGWIGPGEMLNITQTGRYTINAINASSKIKAAKIDLPPANRSGGEYPNDFYIEYRQAREFDANLQRSDLVQNAGGLLINHIFRSSSLSHYPRLLDLVPTPLSWDDDLEAASLTREPTKGGVYINNVFVDASSSITIGPVVDSTATSITFDVAIGEKQCFRAEPRLRIGRNILIRAEAETQSAWSIRTVSAVPTQAIGLTLGNNDYFGCGNSPFTVTLEWPVGWDAINDSRYTIPHLEPQQPWRMLIRPNVPNEAADGVYAIPVVLTSEESDLKTKGEFKVVLQRHPAIGDQPLLP